MKKPLVFALAVLTVGCAALQQAAIPVIDIADATCTELDKQPEPAWVYFLCTVLDAAGNVVQQYEVKEPADKAPQFAADHMPKAAMKKKGDAE